MELNEFQAHCQRTAVYPTKDAVTYCALGLVSEAGEVAGKLKKLFRGDYGVAEARPSITQELGDVFWYVAMLAEELDVPLDDLADGVLSKLQARKAAGTIKGDGDNR